MTFLFEAMLKFIDKKIEDFKTSADKTANLDSKSSSSKGSRKKLAKNLKPRLAYKFLIDGYDEFIHALS